MPRMKKKMLDFEGLAERARQHAANADPLVADLFLLHAQDCVRKANKFQSGTDSRHDMQETRTIQVKAARH